MLLSCNNFFLNTQKVLMLLLEVRQFTLISKIVLNNKTINIAEFKKQIKIKAHNNHSNVMPIPFDTNI